MSAEELANLSPLLRQLPMFENTRGEYVKLGDTHWIILPAEISSFSATTDTLKLKAHLTELLKALGVQVLDLANFFIHIFIPNFPALQHQEQLQILTLLRGFNYIAFKPQLKQFAFIPTAVTPDGTPVGDYRPASHLYDPKFLLFRELFPDRLPSSPFDKPEWHQFLVDIGLQQVPLLLHVFR